MRRNALDPDLVHEEYGDLYKIQHAAYLVQNYASRIYQMKSDGRIKTVTIGNKNYITLGELVKLDTKGALRSRLLAHWVWQMCEFLPKELLDESRELLEVLEYRPEKQEIYVD